MRIFNIELDTSAVHTAFAGTISTKDYNAYRINMAISTDGNKLELDDYANISISYCRDDGNTGSYKLTDSCLYVADNLLVFDIPSTVISKSGYIQFQVQLFKEERRLTSISKFKMRVGDAIDSSNAALEAEIIPIADTIMTALNRKLDKVNGGIVLGETDFTGGLKINGEDISKFIDSGESIITPGSDISSCTSEIDQNAIGNMANGDSLSTLFGKISNNLNDKLSKSSGGTVNGETNFTGGLKNNSSVVLTQNDIGSSVAEHSHTHDNYLSINRGGTVLGETNFTGGLKVDGKDVLTSITGGGGGSLGNDLSDYVSSVMDYSGNEDLHSNDQLKTLFGKAKQRINDKLSKSQGGTVNGETNFTGGLKINGEDINALIGSGGSSNGNYLPITGGTVTGETNFTGGLSVNGNNVLHEYIPTGGVRNANHMAHSFYVSNSGSDETGDGTQENPYGSVNFVLNKIPKDLNGCNYTIMLRNGTYESVEPIRIDRYRNGLICIRGESTNLDNVIIKCPVYITNCWRVELSYLTIDCSAEKNSVQISADNRTDFKIDYVKFYNCTIKSFGNADVRIFQCEFYNCICVFTVHQMGHMYIDSAKGSGNKIGVDLNQGCIVIFSNERYTLEAETAYMLSASRSGYLIKNHELVQFT